MSDIEKKISLKGIDQVLADYNRLKTEVDELKNKSRELRQSTEDNSSNTMNELKGMAASYLSVGAAIGLVTQGIAEQRAEQERVGKVYDDNNQKLLQTLALTNQLANGKQVEAFVKSQPDRDQALAALSGIMAGAPSMNQAEQFRIASALQPLAPVIGGEQMTKLGTLASSLSRIGVTGNPEDVAVLATADAGGNADQLSSPKFLRNVGNMIKMGMDPSAAMALGTMSLNEDLGPKWAGKLVDVLATEDEAKPGDSQRKRSFLNDRNGASRLSRIFSDPKMASEMMGATEALEMGRFDVGLLQRKTTEYGNADLVPEERRRLAMETESGADVIGARAAAAASRRRDDTLGRAKDPLLDASGFFANARQAQAGENEFGNLGFSYLTDYLDYRQLRATGGSPEAVRDAATRMYAGRESAGGWNEEIQKTLLENLRLNNLVNEELLRELRGRSVETPQQPSRSVHGE